MVINPNKSVRKILSFPLKQWGEVAAYQKKNKIKTQAEAIRRLVQIALDKE